LIDLIFFAIFFFRRVLEFELNNNYTVKTGWLKQPKEWLLQLQNATEVTILFTLLKLTEITQRCGFQDVYHHLKLSKTSL